MLDVFHPRCLGSILDISWYDHVTNDEVMARSEQMTLHDIVAIRRRRFVGHIPLLPATRPVSLALEWTPGDVRKRLGKPEKTWQDTRLREDWKRCVWTGVTPERLPAIVPDGDNSLPRSSTWNLGN